MRVLVAMSGGVDSSVAASLLRDEGHEVVGVTLKLWGGNQDSGCCSVGDVEDARRVGQQLGIAHHIFNFSDDFERQVVSPYVDAHARGHTPNPCVECNRHLKFDRLLTRADQLGFDMVATGHHARVLCDSAGRRRLLRGADQAKDQSYVLHMLGQEQLSRVAFPVGTLTKASVRAHAAARGLRTASKSDSQDTCFITATGGRRAFLRTRMPLHPGTIVDADGEVVGTVPALELLTVGQRRGLGGGNGARRYALAVDMASATVRVGGLDDLKDPALEVEGWSWVGRPVAPGTPVMAQVSAHGRPAPAVLAEVGLRWDAPQRRVAPGQAVVVYDAATAAEVLGGGIACGR